MLEISNQEKFNEVIETALLKAKNFPRWQRAINKAVSQIELHGEFMTWNALDKSLLIWSQDSNNIYAANGVCQCKAFEQNQPCFHRAAARLIRIYFETLETKTVSENAAMDSAMKRTPFGMKPDVKFEGFRL